MEIRTATELLAISRALIEDHEGEGVQFIALDDAGQSTGFAKLYWTCETNAGRGIGVMNYGLPVQ